MSFREVAEIVDEAVRKTVETMNPDVVPANNVPSRELPIEDVRPTSEKVNYRIALNPEIFFRYSVFKARVASL